MSVVLVDREPLAVEALGLRTIGQLLSHLRKANRLVVHVLVDGQEPDLNHMGRVRRAPLGDHTLFIETADPRQLAADTLSQVAEQLSEADRLRTDAADLLQRNQNVKAMEILRGCFSIWQSAQESVLKTAQLLRIDLDAIIIDKTPLPIMLSTFTERLHQIKSALETRDFVLLSDILCFEMAGTGNQWIAALDSLRKAIGCPRSR